MPRPSQRCARGLPDNAVAARREAAFRRFEAAGLPHRRVEDWKYTDLRALMRDAKPLAAPPDAAAKARAGSAGAVLAGIDARRIVFVDGMLVPELSDLAPEPGLKISSLAAALGRGDAATIARLGVGPAEGDVAYALNTAFMGDGVVIELRAGHAPGAAAASRLRLRVGARGGGVHALPRGDRRRRRPHAVREP